MKMMMDRSIDDTYLMFFFSLNVNTMYSFSIYHNLPKQVAKHIHTHRETIIIVVLQMMIFCPYKYEFRFIIFSDF